MQQLQPFGWSEIRETWSPVSELGLAEAELPISATSSFHTNMDGNTCSHAPALSNISHPLLLRAIPMPFLPWKVPTVLNTQLSGKQFIAACWWPTSRGAQELPTGLLHISRGMYWRKSQVFLLLYRYRYNSDKKFSLRSYLCSNIDYLAARCQSCCCCLSQVPAEQRRKMMLSLLYPWWAIPN